MRLETEAIVHQYDLETLQSVRALGSGPNEFYGPVKTTEHMCPGVHTTNPVTTNWAPADEGRFWYNHTLATYGFWDGSAIQTLSVVGHTHFGLVPPGGILGWCNGYFTDTVNGGYTLALGSANTVAGANAYLNALGFYVCDGALCSVVGSEIWNAGGRNLPNLSDDRFFQGSTTCGGSGGSSSLAHTHPAGTYAVAVEAAHTHVAGTLAADSVAAHDHAVGSLVNTAEASHNHAVGTYAVDVDNFTSGTGSSHAHTMSGSLGNADANHNHSVSSSTQSIKYPSTGTTITVVTSVTSPSGNQSVTHSHGLGSLAAGNEASHTHEINPPSTVVTGTSAAGSSHNHTISGSVATGGAHGHAISGSTGAGSSHGHGFSGDSGAASATENRPKYFAGFYIVRVL